MTFLSIGNGVANLITHLNALSVSGRGRGKGKGKGSEKEKEKGRGIAIERDNTYPGLLSWHRKLVCLR